MNYDARIDAPEMPDDTGESDPLAFADEDETKSKRKLLYIAIAAGVVLLALWFATHFGKSETGAVKAEQAAVVSVISPGRATVVGTITATGTIGARRELPVGSVGDGGQVAQVLVEAGQWVRQGQVLAYVDRSVQAQQDMSLGAQVQVAQADARLAQANLDRALRLVDRGFISRADVDRLTATRDAANARVRVAGAQRGELRARINRLNIVAPADGLLLERKVEPGQVVSAGTGVLFRIAKGGEMEMLAQMGESDLAVLSTGVTAQITPVGSAKSFAGQVWQLSPVINPQTRQGTARIALPYAPELRPGGFASASIASGTVVAPLLPESAVLADNKGSYTYIVGKDNKVERRDVTLGNVTEKGLVILSGLTGSERVVVRAAAFLSPGETVKPKPVAQAR